MKRFLAGLLLSIMTFLPGFAFAERITRPMDKGTGAGESPSVTSALIDIDRPETETFEYGQAA